MKNDTTQQKPDLNTTLEALQAGKAAGIPTASIFYGLSGLSEAEIKQVAVVWDTLDAGYRRKILQLLTETSETNLELDYRSIAFFALTDANPSVREAAIDLLWEDESLEFMKLLMHMAKQDDTVQVRAAATIALGRFILKGELGDLPESQTAKAQDLVVQLLKSPGEPMEVRRRALEAISNSSHAIVPGAIKQAYESDERLMQLSAVFAMGRSYDNRWKNTVLREIESSDPEMRFEAVRASGELELQEAVPKLARLIDESDREILEMVLWALGEIGGKEAIRVLDQMLVMAEEEEDEELIEAIDDALGNASLIGGDLFDDLDDD